MQKGALRLCEGTPYDADRDEPIRRAERYRHLAQFSTALPP